MLRKNVASQILCFAGVNATSGAALTGASWTGRKCLDGTFSSLSATVTEDTGTGFYKVALAQADTNANDCAYFFTATNAVPVCINAITTAADPTDSVRFGITALPNAAAEAAGGLYTRGTGAGQINQDANGRIDANVKAAAGTNVTLDVNNVLNVSTKYVGGTLQTARDIGASVLLSSGTGTGQLDFTSGVVKSNLDQIKSQTVTCAGGVTVPAATLASTTNISAGTITTVTNLTNAPTSGDLTATMKASVNAEVVDCLNVDTYAEVGQEAPAATQTIRKMLATLYKAWRNKKTQTSSTYSLYADDTTTVDQKATVSDDGTTTTIGEVASGP